MEIVKQILAKDKAFAVIESCETMEQLDVAEKYVDSYRIRFDDTLGAVELSNELRQAKKKTCYE